MKIQPRGRPVQARPHDPLVCGLGYETDCDGCRAAAKEAEALERERRAQERDLALVQRLGPPAMVRRVLLDLLADEITEIALAVAQELHG